MLQFVLFNKLYCHQYGAFINDQLCDLISFKKNNQKLKKKEQKFPAQFNKRKKDRQK